MIARFTSLADYTEFARQHADRGDLALASGSDEWDLGITGLRALDLAVKGDPSIVAKVQRTTLDLTPGDGGSETRWESHVMGSRVDVGAYLAGAPACMRRRARRVSTRHLSIYVSPVGSAQVSAETMLRRGATILGLLETLMSHGINVDLSLMIDTSGHDGGGFGSGVSRDGWDMTRDGSSTQIIPLETRPLDLATAGFALAHPAFFRNVGFAVAHRYGFTGRFSPQFQQAGVLGGQYMIDYVIWLRAHLGLRPQDVIVPRVTAADPLVTDPEKWIAERVAQALQGDPTNV